jgi:hypothetical protein
MKNPLKIIALAFLVFPCSFANAADDHCDDISAYDFYNSEFKLGKGEIIRLEDNYLCGKLDPGQKGCEWDYRISESISFEPEPGVNLKLIHLYKNHVGGSGTWGYAILFQCKDNKLSQLDTNEYLYDFKFQKVDDRTFIITSGHWNPEDSTCCPSSEKKDIYNWSPELKKYVLAESKLVKIDR